MTYHNITSIGTLTPPLTIYPSHKICTYLYTPFPNIQIVLPAPHPAPHVSPYFISNINDLKKGNLEWKRSFTLLKKRERGPAD